MQLYKQGSLVPDYSDVNHPQSVAWNKNGGRFDPELIPQGMRSMSNNMNKYRTDGRFIHRLSTQPVVYHTLPDRRFSIPRLVKKTK
jgi:hypothetical protein